MGNGSLINIAHLHVSLDWERILYGLQINHPIHLVIINTEYPPRTINVDHFSTFMQSRFHSVHFFIFHFPFHLIPAGFLFSGADVHLVVAAHGKHERELWFASLIIVSFFHALRIKRCTVITHFERNVENGNCVHQARAEKNI